MRRVNVLVSLITTDNDFQLEQAAAAEQAARRLGLNTSVIFAGNDAVNQSQQLLNSIHNRGERPDAILVEPVGTGMSQVAKAAVEAGIAWGIVNREVDYLPELRRTANAPVFAVTTDHENVGAIQARQFETLGGKEGGVLYIEGPSAGTVARLRSVGMNSAKPPQVIVNTIRGDWTEQCGWHAVTSWLALSTSRKFNIRIIGSQNDAMSIGARKAFQEMPNADERRKWLTLPFTGCDGAPEGGQKWVRDGLHVATVITPPPMGTAIQLLHDAIRSGSQPPEWTVTTSESFPPIDRLGRKADWARGHHA
jgi:ribose transport system substrate-binding protein